MLAHRYAHKLESQVLPVAVTKTVQVLLEHTNTYQIFIGLNAIIPEHVFLKEANAKIQTVIH